MEKKCITLSPTFEIFEKIEKIAKNSLTRFFHWKNMGNFHIFGIHISGSTLRIKMHHNENKTRQTGYKKFHLTSLLFLRNI